MEQLVVDPDADTGAHDRDDEGAEAAGGVDVEHPEQKLADKAAQNAKVGKIRQLLFHPGAMVVKPPGTAQLDAARAVGVGLKGPRDGGDRLVLRGRRFQRGRLAGGSVVLHTQK